MWDFVRYINLYENVIFEFVNILRQETFFFFFIKKKNINNFDISSAMISFEYNKNVNFRGY